MKLSRQDMAETAWKWRCKAFPAKSGAKTFDDGSSSDLDGANVKKEVVTVGVDATVKTLFEGKNSNPTHNAYEWVDYPPKQISKSTAKAQDRPAIKVYKIKDREKHCIGGRLPLTYHSIEIQNSTLVEALEPILKKELVHLDTSDTARFLAPFRPLYFCYDAILELYRQTPAEVALKAYLRLLVGVLDDVFGELRKKSRLLQSNRLANFKTLWTLFPRNTTLYQSTGRSETVYKVDTSEYRNVMGAFSLVLSCKCMSFSGEDFVWVDKDIDIQNFKGNLPIDELPAYPLSFHTEFEAVRARLVARGRKVLDFQDLTYSTYRGIGLSVSSDGIQRHNVDGRILIDIVGYNKYHLKLTKRPATDKDGKTNSVVRGAMQPDIDGAAESKPDETANVVFQTAVMASQSTPTPTEKGYKRLTEEERLQNKTDMFALGDEVMYMGPTLEGYALKNKLWLNFFVDDISPIVWNDKAYDHLVYNELQKDLLLSFVENHGRTPGQLEDVIMGKGLGLIMLLSGPPGTGKTLTAEAIADRSHRPLFYLQAEDLGIIAATLGENIKRVFSMATDWNAVVLLDEADVFMSERSPHDIHRNELVSIFLRELEYFRGIIFLTTNMYHAIDSAFRSRVSLHLLFKALSVDARELVWRKFLGMLTPLSHIPAPALALPPAESVKGAERAERAESAGSAGGMTDADVKQLALWQLNGREIKNAVKMTRSWCEQKKYEMTLSRLESGIKVTKPDASKDGERDDSLYD